MDSERCDRIVAESADGHTTAELIGVIAELYFQIEDLEKKINGIEQQRNERKLK